MYVLNAFRASTPLKHGMHAIHLRCSGLQAGSVAERLRSSTVVTNAPFRRWIPSMPGLLWLAWTLAARNVDFYELVIYAACCSGRSGKQRLARRSNCHCWTILV